MPLRAYMKNGRVKIEIGLARGKHAHDKREAIKKKDQEREAQTGARRRQLTQPGGPRGRSPPAGPVEADFLIPVMIGGRRRAGWMTSGGHPAAPDPPERQYSSNPPSTPTTAPLMKDARSEARNR